MSCTARLRASRFFLSCLKDDDEIIPNVINAVKVVTGKARMKADPASSLSSRESVTKLIVNWHRRTDTPTLLSARGVAARAAMLEHLVVLGDGGTYRTTGTLNIFSM
jgi:hypothetical protein